MPARRTGSPGPPHWSQISPLRACAAAATPRACAGRLEEMRSSRRPTVEPCRLDDGPGVAVAEPLVGRVACGPDDLPPPGWNQHRSSLRFAVLAVAPYGPQICRPGGFPPDSARPRTIPSARRDPSRRVSSQPGTPVNMGGAKLTEWASIRRRTGTPKLGHRSRASGWAMSVEGMAAVVRSGGSARRSFR